MYLARSVALGPLRSSETQVSVLRLRAPGMRSRVGVSMGGASYGADTTTGRLSPPKLEVVHLLRGAFRLTVPSASAALITFGRG